MSRLCTFLLFFLICLFIKNSRCSKIFGDDDAINIAAFNVRVFGRSKMSKNISHHLVNIILRYDLILIQEIRDSKGDAIKELFKQLRSKSNSINQSARFEMTLSPRLGRTASKEEYAFIYRADKLQLLSSYTFADINDVFEREPYIVTFYSPKSAVQTFAVAGIHISPKDASNEISQLPSVYDDVIKTVNTKNLIIMGDFNAGCDYIKDWDNITLATDQRFFWLIDNSVDTTTETSDCPYDRIVVSGDELIKAIIPESSGVFLFDKEYNLNKEEALEISDHYPVHMKLRLKEEEEQIDVQSRKIVYDKRVASYVQDNIYAIYQMRTKAIRRGVYKVTEKFTKSGAYIQIVISATSLNSNDVKNLLDKFRNDFPNFVTGSQAAIAKRYFKNARSFNHLPDGRNKYRTLKDYYMLKTKRHIIELVCHLKNRKNPNCGLQIFME